MKKTMRYDRFVIWLVVFWFAGFCALGMTDFAGRIDDEIYITLCLIWLIGIISIGLVKSDVV